MNSFGVSGTCIWFD